MLSDLRITRADKSRVGEVDFDNLGFGNIFSDHMFSCRYADGAWHSPEIVPYGPIAVSPANATLHYGQSVFEGLKAYRGTDGKVRVFRPDQNAKRLRQSSARLCIPMLEEEDFLEAIDALLTLDHHWIPGGRGEALYVRPIVFSDEEQLEVRPSTQFRLVIMTAPVRAYFDASMGAIALKVEDRFTRSAPGGTGYAKTAGNYSASLYPGESARNAGYAQVLWLDGAEHKYVEEVGAMNIFFRMGDKIVTPSLHGTILPGITRDSVIKLLVGRGIDVEERLLEIDEVIAAAKSGALTEAFGAGTAAIIAPVGKMAYKGEEVLINDNRTGDLTREMYDTITGIQLGEVDDPYGWTRIIDLEQSNLSSRRAVS